MEGDFYELGYLHYEVLPLKGEDFYLEYIYILLE